MSNDAGSSPAGLEPSILIVYQHSPTASALAALLRRDHCTVVGPVDTAPAALDLIRQQSPATALLDADLGSEVIYPVAHLLKRQAIPFVSVTSGGSREVVPRLVGIPTFRKPIHYDEVWAMIYNILRTRGADI